VGAVGTADGTAEAGRSRRTEGGATVVGLGTPPVRSRHGSGDGLGRVVLLPRVPEHQGGHGEDDEGDEALGVDHVSGLVRVRGRNPRRARDDNAKRAHREPRAVPRAVPLERFDRESGSTSA
jgi:hypothetical protein